MGSIATTPLILNLGERLSVRDRVTEALREAMVAGTMTPDTVYSAPALAQLLNVSATPVREAMIDLAREGHVEVIRNRGYRVVPISDDDLDDIIDMRTLLEVPTVARVARLATPEQIAALRPIAVEVDRTAAQGLLREHITADNVFHLGLLAIAGNRMVVNEVRRLRGLTRLSALQEMYDLVEAGDAEGAAQLMTRHLGHARGVWVGRPEA
jgi:DNA-binding GntR family transcriptional regulator